MGAKGTANENKTSIDIQLYAGLALIEEIVAINPTNEQKAKMYGYEYDESRDETEYTGETPEQNSKLSLDIYFKARGVETPRKHRFFLEDTPIEFEDKEDGDKVKYKFVNQVGQITSAESEDDLADWFTNFQKWDKDNKQFVNTGEKKTFRKCLKGEDGLMRFLREALNINYDLPSASLAYNYKKLFAGNVKELLTDLQGELFRKFVVMFQVTSKDGDDGVNHYEKLWLPNNNFGVPMLSEDCYKHINNGCNFPSGWLGKKWKKYCETHSKYPPAGYAPLTALVEYNEANDVAGGKTAKSAVPATAAHSNDDSDY